MSKRFSQAHEPARALEDYDVLGVAATEDGGTIYRSSGADTKQMRQATINAPSDYKSLVHSWSARGNVLTDDFLGWRSDYGGINIFSASAFSRTNDIGSGQNTETIVNAVNSGTTQGNVVIVPNTTQPNSDGILMVGVVSAINATAVPQATFGLGSTNALKQLLSVGNKSDSYFIRTPTALDYVGIPPNTTLISDKIVAIASLLDRTQALVMKRWIVTESGLVVEDAVLNDPLDSAWSGGDMRGDFAQMDAECIFYNGTDGMYSFNAFFLDTIPADAIIRDGALWMARNPVGGLPIEFLNI